MSTHSEIQSLLYEYLRNELDETTADRVRLHLISCTTCSQELDEILGVSRMLDTIANDASAERSPEYWREYIDEVERKIRVAQAEDRLPLPEIRYSPVREFFEELFGSPARYAVAFGAACVILIGGVFAWRWIADNRVARDTETALNQRALNEQARQDSIGEFMKQYVHESKMVLVGFSNMKPVDGSTYDLSVEREKSRELVLQARFLEGQRLDPHSAKLVGDLQKILIELANMKDQGNAPNVEIVRSGVQEENLLFKIRMEEQSYQLAGLQQNPAH